MQMEWVPLGGLGLEQNRRLAGLDIDSEVSRAVVVRCRMNHKKATISRPAQSLERIHSPTLLLPGYFSFLSRLQPSERSSVGTAPKGTALAPATQRHIGQVLAVG